MSWKKALFSTAMATSLVLVGCQGNDTNQEGMNHRQNDFEQTRNDGRFDRMSDGLNPISDQTTENQRRNNLDNNRIEDRTNRYNRIEDRTNRYNRNDSRPQHRSDSNTRYEVADEAADKITDEIDGVDYAYVLTTNNNAYVAVVFDRDQGDRRSNITRTRQGNDQPQIRNSRNNDQANRNTTNYVADDVKKEISDIVRSIDEDIDQVYVTTNPDFVDLTNNYINDFNEGRPIQGLFEQMGEMIQRIFPQNTR